jgi:hypothetical protein
MTGSPIKGVWGEACPGGITTSLRSVVIPGGRTLQPQITPLFVPLRRITFGDPLGGTQQHLNKLLRVFDYFSSASSERDYFQ